MNAHCAIEVRTGGPDGSLLLDDMLEGGDSVRLPSTGVLWLRLGDPHAVTIEANGSALILATPARPAPYDVIFEFSQ